MEIKIIIEPSPGLQKFLDTFLTLASAQPIVAPGVAKTTTPKAMAAVPAAPAAGEPVTKEMLQTFAKNNKAKRDAIVAVLGKYGAASISTAQETDYAAIYADFQNL